VEVSVLLGPAEADHFRRKVGRYGDRFYCDGLPACDLAPEWDGVVPSFSTVKTPFGNKFYTLGLVAGMPDEQWHRLAECDRDERYATLKANDAKAGRVNMDRGTIIHLWAEQMLLGKKLSSAKDLAVRYSPEAVEAAKKYGPALKDWFQVHQPELVAAEVVCISRGLNGVGFGQTIDTFVRIAGAVWSVDFKSRTESHSIYLEESCQVAGPLLCDYMIVADGNGGAKRAPIPDLAGGLIVSLVPTGHRSYPVEIDAVKSTFTAMHQWWVAQRDYRDSGAVGKAWAPQTAPATEATTASEPVAGAPSTDGGSSLPSPSAVEPPSVELTPAEQKAQMPVSPDEGAPCQRVAYQAIKARFESLGDAERGLFTSVVREAMHAGVSIHMKENPTVRRFEIARGMVALLPHLVILDDDVDDILRALVAAALDSEAPLFPVVTIGHAVGSLDVEAAKRFADLCWRFAESTLPATVDDQGRLRFEVVAA